MNPFFFFLALFGFGVNTSGGGGRGTATTVTFTSELPDEDTMTGGDGHGDHMGEDTMTGGDGHGDHMGEDTMTGGDGHGDHMGEDTMTGGDGHGDHMGEDTMTGGDGHGDHMGEDTMTGGDGHGDHMGEDTMTGGDGHVGHEMPAIAPPGPDATPLEIAIYIDALFALEETHVHSTAPDLTGEHSAAMNLVPRDVSTHVAISDGDWFDPAIWAGGEVPGDDARVLIPEGVMVSYGGMSDARLFTVRVDGTLDFETDTSSQMIFDTFVVTPTGHLIIGTATDPVHPDVDIDLIVANNGPIDTDWDPLLLSRGMLLHGETTIHGAVKDSHEKVDEDPMAGDTSVSFTEVPEGWQVGDTIVIAGTHYDGYKWDNDIRDVRLYPAEDEIRVITQIDEDGTIHFAEPLVHDHDTPRDDLFTSVANYTRNVSIETENAETAEIYERGHLMFMHSDDVDVRYLEVHELGRTDKSDPTTPQDDQVNEFDTNVQGRYAFHLHRSGTENIDDPAIIVGSSVWGSPGWGYVHHDSNALFENNASYDTFGAGYVAETGNETGAWIDNIAIYAEGISWASPKNAVIIGADDFDTARSGDGFWFNGRMVASTDNVAASVNTGFVYFHRGSADFTIDPDIENFAYPDALYLDETVRPELIPILTFDGNETFAAKEGLHVVKAGPNQGHDVWSHINDFTAWSVMSGAHLEYTSHYILKDLDLIAKDPTAFSDPGSGISFGNNTSETVIIDARIDGFETGISLKKGFTDPSWTEDQHDFVVIDAVITNAGQDYGYYDPALDLITTRADLPDLQADLTLDPLVMHTGTQNNILITGTKTDTLGTVDFPGGTDSFKVDFPEAVKAMQTKGYWTTSSDQHYFLLDIYFTDRVTGEIFYETHPVMLSDEVVNQLHWPGYTGIVYNGTQDLTTENGVLYAGDTPLDVAIAVPLPEVPTVPENTASMTMDSAMHTHAAMTEDLWVNGHDGEETLTLDIHGGYFVNIGQMENTDLTATGGETVLASEGAEFDLGASRTLAIFDAAAKVGFDGENGGIAILDMHEGSTLAYSAESGDLGTIEEFDSSAFAGDLDVQSGIDLGGTTLEVDLTGLSAEAGTEFMLMDADELVGVFNDPAIGGLGMRDATIVVDYLNDSVTLKLSAGTGLVTVETLGEESDVTAGEEDLWAALTADHGLAEDQPLPEEEELLDAVA